MNILDLADRGYQALPIDKESTDVLLAAGKLLEAALRRRVSRSGGPSAPGESPAKLTGELEDSFRTRVIRRRRSARGDKVRVGTNLPQAPALNFGYAEKGRVLAPRPFMEPALADVKDQMTSLVRTKMRARGVRELRNTAAERAARREHEAGA
jgi:hypothetical protein